MPSSTPIAAVLASRPLIDITTDELLLSLTEVVPEEQAHALCDRHCARAERAEMSPSDLIARQQRMVRALYNALMRLYAESDEPSIGAMEDAQVAIEAAQERF